MKVSKFVLLFFLAGCVVGSTGCTASPLPNVKRVDVARLTQVILGPFHRSDIVMSVSADSTLRVDGDLFEFALLHGHPPHGRYDWFKVAREEGGATWYLVLGSSSSRLEWVEAGTLHIDDRAGIRRFELERVDGAEGEREKNVREFTWTDQQNGAARLSMTNYRKIAFSPGWGEPRRLDVSFVVKTVGPSR